jgi:hypothetical protein
MRWVQKTSMSVPAAIYAGQPRKLHTISNIGDAGPRRLRSRGNQIQAEC